MVIKYVNKNDTLLFYFPCLSLLFSFGFLAGGRVSHLLPTVECGPPALIPYLRFSEVPASRRNLSAGPYSVGAKLPFLLGDPETLKGSRRQIVVLTSEEMRGLYPKDLV